MLEVSDIIKRIPHRFPMLLIDRVIELEPGQRGVGIKCVSINEPYFQGHFPQYPIVPGVLIIESLAQLSAVVFSEYSFNDSENSDKEKVVEKRDEKDRPGYLAGVNMRYRQPVKPGDVLHLEVSLIKRMGRTIKVKVTAKVEDNVVAHGEMTFA